MPEIAINDLQAHDMWWAGVVGDFRAQERQDARRFANGYRALIPHVAQAVPGELPTLLDVIRIYDEQAKGGVR